MSSGPTRGESRHVVYQEICKSHGAIADFRAKLLALLPAASGASVFILLEKDTNATPAQATHAHATHAHLGLLGPLGLFGFAAIFGLFMYELRGVEDCVKLRKRAEEME